MSSSISTLSALSPLDGRYASKTDALRPWLSEAAFMRQRVAVEVHWLIALAQSGLPDMPKFSADSEKSLLELVEKFSDVHNFFRVKANEILQEGQRVHTSNAANTGTLKEELIELITNKNDDSDIDNDSDDDNDDNDNSNNDKNTSNVLTVCSIPEFIDIEILKNKN